MSGSGSRRRSCHRGRARPRRSSTCCRCRTCTGSRAGTSCPRRRSSSALPRACPPRRSRSRPRPGRPRRARAPNATCRPWTRLPVGRRHPCQRAPGGGQAAPAAMIGTRRRPQELIALTDGYREATESWRISARRARRGMRAPALAIGDGALVLGRVAGGVPRDPRAALLVPQAIECSAAPPQSLYPGAKRCSARSSHRDNANTRRRQALQAVYRAKFPRRSPNHRRRLRCRVRLLPSRASGAL